MLAADALVLPGVGAFKDGMAGLERAGADRADSQKAAAGTPLLGICLGMQMLFDESEEFGLHKGLGLIPGRVVKIPALDTMAAPRRCPTSAGTPCTRPAAAPILPAPLLAAVTPGEECYFIHSYEAKPTDEADRLADTVLRRPRRLRRRRPRQRIGLPVSSGKERPRGPGHSGGLLAGCP